MSEAQYRDDYYVWTQDQAARIRALAGSNAFDVELVAEEIESLGRSDLRAVRSLIAQKLVHMIKLARAPDAGAAQHWRGEIATFGLQAEETFSPGMRQALDAEALWASAWRAVGVAEDGRPLDPPGPCPFGIEELLDPRRDLNPDVTRISALIAAAG